MARRNAIPDDGRISEYVFDGEFEDEYDPEMTDAEQKELLRANPRAPQWLLGVGRHEEQLYHGGKKWGHQLLEELKEKAGKEHFDGEERDMAIWRRQQKNKEAEDKKEVMQWANASTNETLRRIARETVKEGSRIKPRKKGYVPATIDDELDLEEEEKKARRAQRWQKKSKLLSTFKTDLEKQMFQLMALQTDGACLTHDPDEAKELLQYAYADPRIMSKEDKEAVGIAVMTAIRPCGYDKMTKDQKRKFKEYEMELIKKTERPILKNTIKHIAKKYGFDHRYLHDYNKRRFKWAISGVHNENLEEMVDFLRNESVDMDREQCLVAGDLTEFSSEYDHEYPYRNLPVFTPDTPFDDELMQNARKANQMPVENLRPEHIEHRIDWQARGFYDSQRNKPFRRGSLHDRSEKPVSFDTEEERKWYEMVRLRTYPRDCHTREATEVVMFVISKSEPEAKLPNALAALAGLRMVDFDHFSRKKT